MQKRKLIQSHKIIKSRNSRTKRGKTGSLYRWLDHLPVAQLTGTAETQRNRDTQISWTSTFSSPSWSSPVLVVLDLLTIQPAGSLWMSRALFSWTSFARTASTCTDWRSCIRCARQIATITTRSSSVSMWPWSTRRPQRRPRRSSAV